MANNELSGPIVSMGLIEYFQNKKNLKTLRFIFIPETIGSITYLSKNLPSLKEKVIGGYNLSCIGDNRSHSCMLSKYENSPSDHALLAVYKIKKINYKKYSFLERGSDERQYNSPGVDLPITSIFRTKYGKFKEYHTSLDDFKVVTKEGIKGGFDVAKKAIEILQSFEWEETKGKTVIRKEPIGVVGMITPWNWPINQISCKVAPALAAGCTMVLKPTEIAPLNAILFAEVMHEAEVPKGVFNLVNGDGPTVGEAMSSHPGIDMMSFTGSTRAGISVAKGAADTVKRVAQELGGKSANIILDDADFESAVSGGVNHCFLNFLLIIKIFCVRVLFFCVRVNKILKFS